MIYPQGVLYVLDWNCFWYLVCVVGVWQRDISTCGVCAWCDESHQAHTPQVQKIPYSMTFSTWRWWGCQPHARAVFTPGMFLVLIFTRGWVDPRAMVRSEGNMSLKNLVTPPGIDPGTVRLVAQRLNHYATPGPTFMTVPSWSLLKIRIISPKFVEKIKTHDAWSINNSKKSVPVIR